MTYKMMDEDVAVLSPSTVYRILKKKGLLVRWNIKISGKGTGFKQPIKAHDHWHTDISYINILGNIFYLISVLDGYSRYVLEYDVRASMTEYDVELVLQKCHEKHPDAKPRIISDNGAQFISKDFKEFIKLKNFTHVRTSVNYPQSNGKIERFHGTIKQEAIRKQSYVSEADAKRQIKNYIDKYNNQRLHSALYYLTPADFLFNRFEEKLKIRETKIKEAKERRIKTWLTSAA